MQLSVNVATVKEKGSNYFFAIFLKSQLKTQTRILSLYFVCNYCLYYVNDTIFASSGDAYLIKKYSWNRSTLQCLSDLQLFISIILFITNYLSL